jgi:hypothetical protein
VPGEAHFETENGVGEVEIAKTLHDKAFKAFAPNDHCRGKYG